MGISQTSSSWINRLLVLLIVAVLVVVDSPLLARHGDEIARWVGISAAWLEPNRLIECLAIIAIPLAIAVGAIETVHLAMIVLAGEIAPRLLPYSPSFLVFKASGIVLYFYVALLVGALRRSMTWVRAGKIDGRSALLAGVVVVVAALALIGWVKLLHPNMAAYANVRPNGTRVELAEYMGLFAVANALLEEILYRGVMMTALDAAFGAGWFALVVQAVSFGMAHYHGGFPCGWVGVGMTFFYGLAMGVLRRRSNGLLLPWITHTAADLTVICLVVYFA